MAHYALINASKIVTDIITGRNETEVVNDISDWETYYGNLHNTTCKRTSYNTFGNVHKEGGTPFRKNYAEIGGTYSEELDAFIPIKPFPSWVLNEETGRWVAPVRYPIEDEVPQQPKDDKVPGDYVPGVTFTWNEGTLSWDSVVL